MDGDTSTNDTVIGLASGAAGGALISDRASPEAAQLEAAVTALLQVLLRKGHQKKTPLIREAQAHAQAQGVVLTVQALLAPLMQKSSCLKCSLQVLGHVWASWELG